MTERTPPGGGAVPSGPSSSPATAARVDPAARESSAEGCTLPDVTNDTGREDSQDAERKREGREAERQRRRESQEAEQRRRQEHDDAEKQRRLEHTEAEQQRRDAGRS